MPVYSFWVGSHTVQCARSMCQSLCRSEVTRKNKQLEVEGVGGTCTITGNANVAKYLNTFVFKYFHQVFIATLHANASIQYRTYQSVRQSC